LLKNKSKRRRS